MVAVASSAKQCQALLTVDYIGMSAVNTGDANDVNLLRRLINLSLCLLARANLTGGRVNLPRSVTATNVAKHCLLV
jgi:hypothetical protein